MTKAAIEKFVSELEAIGVTEYFLRIEGGNRVISHGNDSSRLILEDDRIICIETQNNYNTGHHGNFNIKIVEYDSVDSVSSNAITTADLLKYVENNISEDKKDEVKELIKNTGKRVILKPGSGNYGTKPDQDFQVNRVTNAVSEEPEVVDTKD